MAIFSTLSASVTWLENAGSILGNITSSKEIILSAGVLGTPQILLNSGIGNMTELHSLGILPIHDLPEVGKGLTEHTGAGAVWAVNSQEPVLVSRCYLLLLAR